LTTYALDATDPDQGLDRFREYVRSAQHLPLGRDYPGAAIAVVRKPL
jgi:hypothetical protein